MIISINKMESVLQCFLLSVLFLGFTNIFSTVAGSSQGLYSGNQVVVEGDAFNITCQTDVFAFIKWQKDSRSIVGDLLKQYNVTEYRGGDTITSSISTSHAQISQSGSYRCGTFVENSYHLYVLSANSISVNYDPDSTRYKSIIFKTPLEIQCNTTESGTRMEWYKNGVNITLPNDKRVTIEGNKLVIPDPKDEDAGNYTCKAVSTKVNGTIAERLIEVIVKPYVGMQKDVTVVEGEKLKLECVVVGKPPPDISWTFGNETYYGSRGRVVLKEHNGVANALFVIKEATMEDRGVYSCNATNANNSTDSATSNVRVKDKLAALWPFLGICAEVFVLCAIILIYEKKRNKTELEESDTDNSPETKNTPDHGKDSVRQRK